MTKLDNGPILTAVVNTNSKIAIGLVGVVFFAWLLPRIPGLPPARFNSNADVSQTASRLEGPKEWKKLTLGPLTDVGVTLSTMWRDGRLYYQFFVNGYPNAVRTADRSTGFTIVLEDANGFKLTEVTIPLRNTTTRINAAGKETGLDAKGDVVLQQATYERLASWNVSWNFPIPKEAPQPPRQIIRANPSTPTTKPVRVGGQIKQPTKIKHVAPAYPPSAQSARVQGVVIIEAVIGPNGKVQDARVLRSIPMLDQAALDAVKQWEFTPTLMNDEPVPVIMTVTVQFTLS